MKKGLKRSLLWKIMRLQFPHLPRYIPFVLIGTTGLCNASCIHCPTGKSRTAASPRTPMKIELFRKLIDGIAALPLSTPSHIGFGLFGDGLVDPFVMERMKYARRYIPDGHFVINTNGAAFSKDRHLPLNELVDVIALHCESLDEATFERLMQPLRAKNVFPKYQAILDGFPGKVHVSVPISRENISEAADIRSRFLDMGAAHVQFDPLISRCEPDPTIFEGLALAPHPIRCGPEVLDNLIIDCDGTMLICCQDFAREEAIGSLADHSLPHLLSNVERMRVRRLFKQGGHIEMATCSRCYGDLRTEDFPFDTTFQPSEAVV